MELATFECKLAQLQLSRFQEGHPLSAEAIAALEEHLEACPLCQQSVAKKAEPAPEAAAPTPTEPVTEPNPVLPKLAISKAILNAVPGRFRTLALAGLLGITLWAMSAISNDPTKLLGPRASALPARDAAVREVASGVVVKPENKPMTEPHLAIQLDQAKYTKPAPEPAQTSAPKPTAASATAEPAAKPAAAPAAKPAAKPRVKPAAKARRAKPVRRATTTRRAPAPKPARKPASSGIVIYDAEGKRIR